MRLTNILVLVFILAAFAVGAGLQDAEIDTVNEVLNNASLIFENISISTASSAENIYIDRGLIVFEKFIDFFGTAYIEVMRVGVIFGSENPQFFEPEFIIKIIKLLVTLAIVSLLIQPVFYLIVFIVMVIIFIKDYITKIKNNKRDGRKENN